MSIASAGNRSHQRRPAIQYRQDRIRLGRGQTDHYARDAEVAVSVQAIEVLSDAEQRDRE